MADGQTRRIVYANGAATAFTYAPQRRFLARIETTHRGGLKVLDNAYARDALGRITAIDGVRTVDDWAYGYDGFDRLVSAANAGDAGLSETFAHTLSGNLTGRTRLSGQGAFAWPAGRIYAPPIKLLARRMRAGTRPRPHAPLTRRCPPARAAKSRRRLIAGGRSARPHLRAPLAEPVDARDLKSLGLGRAGSSPAGGTTATANPAPTESRFP